MIDLVAKTTMLFNCVCQLNRRVRICVRSEEWEEPPQYWFRSSLAHRPPIETFRGSIDEKKAAKVNVSTAIAS